MGTTTSTLPWSLREKLVVWFRHEIVGNTADPDLPKFLVEVLERFVALPGAGALRDVVRDGIDGVSLAECVRSWMGDLPPTRRAEWLVDRLTEGAGLHWEAQPKDVEGPISLPSAERDRIVQRFERLREQRLSRFDDEPDADE